MAMDKLRALSLPTGFEFRPTDEEIISNYLTRKVLGEKIDFDVIPELDVSNHKPWQLSLLLSVPKSDTQWHFFGTKPQEETFRNRQYAEGGNYWRFQRDTKIRQNNKVVGMRKSRVFYERQKTKSGKRVYQKLTEWKMHEYYLNENEYDGVPPDKKDLYLCRITQKHEKYQVNADTSAPADAETSAPADELNTSTQDIVPLSRRGLNSSAPEFIPSQQRGLSASAQEFVPSWLRAKPPRAEATTLNIYNMKRKLLGDLYGKDGAVGFEFRPTDTELITHYLKKKVLGEKIEFDIIPEFDIYNHAPWDLPSIFTGLESDTNWYFFTPADINYLTTPRKIKAMRAGFWKPRSDEHIMVREKIIGAKKFRRFYKFPKGERTIWVMHEYFLDENKFKDVFSNKKDLFVLCQVTKMDTECLTDADASAPAEVVANELHQMSLSGNSIGTGNSNNTSPQEDTEIGTGNRINRNQQEDTEIGTGNSITLTSRKIQKWFKSQGILLVPQQENIEMVQDFFDSNNKCSSFSFSLLGSGIVPLFERVGFSLADCDVPF